MHCPRPARRRLTGSGSASIVPLRLHSRDGEATMDHFNSESTLPGTVVSDDSLTAIEIMTAIIPALVGMAAVGFIALLMLL